ncbi:acyltransferase [Syncephalastrum racemosum]|uniref:Acyltransferase n=1 Tax=Syncephalastrum racemosum TaxID=13706 RepID=A0A1X2H7T4_SYNRA|nr:acyltransferase [Syncephalastrum racemosum]
MDGHDQHRNIMAHEPQHLRDNPLAFFTNIKLHYQGEGWRGYNNYIGNKILYPGFSARMKELVLGSTQVANVIDAMASQQSIQQMEKVLEAKRLSPTKQKLYYERLKEARRQELLVIAEKITNECVVTMDSPRIVRSLAFVVNTVLARLYNQGIYIKEREWEELKRVARQAERHKQSLVFLPAHRSHIDYLVINYVIFRLGIQLPHVIGGNNMNLPGLGNVMKSSGALYIRRQWGDDTLYKTVLEEYITTLMLEGMNLQCFVEGTRSRVGKLLAPKLGFIKIILNAIMDNRVQDCYIVPLSASYDKIIETSTYANELLGVPKEKETLWGVLKSANVLQVKWGQVDVRLGKPYSLRQWLQNELKHRSMLRLENSNDRNVIYKSFGYRALADINIASVIMPSALVGTVLLTLRGRGVGKAELVRRVNWMISMIKAKGGSVAEFHGMSTNEVVERSLTIHKDLIGKHKQKDILEPTYYGIDRFELSYYRNQVIHLFVEESIVCSALYTVVKRGGGRLKQRLRYAEMLNQVSFLSGLLKLEMIYKPGGIESNTRRTIQWLVDQRVLCVSEDGWIGLSDEEWDCGRENYDFLCFLIWPFVDAYWLACVSLFSLVPPSINSGDTAPWVDSAVFASRLQSLGKTLYYQGDLSYLEAVNKESLATALKSYTQLGILRMRHHTQPKPWSELSLSVEFMPKLSNGILVPEGHLWNLADRIGQFRREGKNRRDNAAVSSRVLRLATIIAQDNVKLSPNQKALTKKAEKSKL